MVDTNSLQGTPAQTPGMSLRELGERYKAELTTYLDGLSGEDEDRFRAMEPYVRAIEGAADQVVAIGGIWDAHLAVSANFDAAQLAGQGAPAV